MAESTLPLIRLENITKSFGALRANDGISLEIRAGTIKALLGENGAGKSTLMNILAGRLRPDSGRIFIQDRPAAIDSAADAIKCGIGMVYQHFMLVEALTVAENIFLGQPSSFWMPPGVMEKKVAALARRYGLGINPTARVADLSMGEKQRVEILKLLQRQSRILIFDEPTAVLTPPEIDQLFDALRQMAAQDKAIVFISHKLGEVMAVADEIAILQKGRIVSELNAQAVETPAELAYKMIGREVLLKVDREPLQPRQRVLRVNRLNGDGIQDISLDLRQGEILGLVGVAGNGQKQLVETICGLRSSQSGSINILGQDWAKFYQTRAWSGNLIYIPEDRRGLATCLGLDLVDNFLLTTRRGFVRGPLLNRSDAAQYTRKLMGQFGIHPPDSDALAGQLSGGNLQKLVLAREFYRRPKLIVAEQPTQGLDIGATEDIWRLLLNAREQAGILLVTGDLGEALALSDRIAVMFNGRIMDTFSSADTQKIKQIGPLMAGLPGPEGGERMRVPGPGTPIRT